MTEIWQYVRVVSRWWWLILVGTVLATGLGWSYANTIPPVYVASASMLVRAGGAADDYGSVMASEKMAETYKTLLTKRPVLQEAAQALGLDVEQVARQVNTHLVTKTLIIELSVEDHNPHMAAALANQIVEAFMRSVRDSVKARPRDVTVVELATPPLEPVSPNHMRLTVIAGLIGLVLCGGFAFGIEYLRTPLVRVSDIHRYLGLATLAVIPRAHLWKNRSRRSADAQAAGVQAARMQAASTPSALRHKPGGTFGSWNARRRASASPLPISPYTMRFGVVSRIRALLQPRSGGRPSSGMPNSAPRNGEPMALHDPNSNITDAYRTLRTWLQFSHREQTLPSLLVTSPSSRKTKDAVVANLGIVLAQAGLRVVVVDADLREPSLHRLLDTQGGPGLSELLAGAGDWRTFLAHTDVTDLDLIPAGLLTGVPAGDALGLLSSARVSWLIHQLENRYDVVLIHGPPTLGAADAFVLSAQASATVLVIESRSTLCKRAVQALTLLRNAQATVLGAVLTQAKASTAGAYADFYLASRTTELGAGPAAGPDTEPAAEPDLALERHSVDYAGDFAATYARHSQRAMLPRGMLNSRREPEQTTTVEPRDDEQDEAPQEEPVEFIEGHLVTLADLFSEPSSSAD